MTLCRFFVPGVLAGVLVVAAPTAQEWTAEDLDEHIQGFLEDGAQARFAQIAKLVAEQDVAGRAISAKIHGDHREYLLKIERLIDELTDERWLEREQAERTLIELGARARELIRQHRDEGRLLEERIRCKRILEQIEARGTEKEERETRILRGLTAAASYLRPSPRLTRALLSALGHTDPQVVEYAARALGIQGEKDNAKAIRPLVDRGGNLRATALTSLCRMRGAEALNACMELIKSGALTRSETIAVIRCLRKRPDAREAIASLRNHSDPMIAAAAQLDLGDGQPTAVPVQLKLSDQSVLQQKLLDLTCNSVVVSSPVEGLPKVEIGFDECDVLVFDSSPSRVPAGMARVFLTQGSLVTGKLVGFEDGKVQVQSPLWGLVTIPREAVQGIALDPKLDRLIGASTETDRIRLDNQSLVDGEIVAIGPDQLSRRTAVGQLQQVPMKDVTGILFKRPRQTRVDDNLYVRLDLQSGDRILGNVAAMGNGMLGVVAPTLGSTTLPIRSVKRMEIGVSGGALWGFTLIADYSDNRIVEVDDQGKETFVMDDVYGAWDVECLDNGNLLITEFAVSRVQEMTREGKTVWSYEDLRNPYDADRLPNGNTLIADTFAGRVIEVNHAGEVVWSYDKDIRPFDVDRLPNGNTLIADVLKDRVIEIDRDGHIVWEKKNLPSVHDADRLPNGNTLITLRTLNRVIEIDRNGKEVFRLDNLNAPSDADRLPNGNTIVAENNGVREFDRNGNVVWKKEMTWAVEVNRY